MRGWGWDGGEVTAAARAAHGAPAPGLAQAQPADGTAPTHLQVVSNQHQLRGRQSDQRGQRHLRHAPRLIYNHSVDADLHLWRQQAQAAAGSAAMGSSVGGRRAAALPAARALQPHACPHSARHEACLLPWPLLLACLPHTPPARRPCPAWCPPCRRTRGCSAGCCAPPRASPAAG